MPNRPSLALLSLKEFYDDQREHHQSPNELEMRIYHRLGLIRDQHKRNDEAPPHIAGDQAFQLITRFRSQVQDASRPITKTSTLRVNQEAMQTFGELANVLKERGNVVMVYLVACFLEHIFGRDTIDDIEDIRDGMSIQDIIDGVTFAEEEGEDDGIEDEEVFHMEDEEMQDGNELDAFIDDAIEDDGMGDDSASQDPQPTSTPLKRGATEWLTQNFGNVPLAPTPVKSVFGQLASQNAPISGNDFHDWKGGFH